MTWYPYFIEFYATVPINCKKTDFEMALQMIGCILWNYGCKIDFRNRNHEINANKIVDYIIKEFVTNNNNFEYKVSVNTNNGMRLCKNKEELDSILNNNNLCGYGGFYPTENNIIFTNFDVLNVNPPKETFDKVIENCKQYISYENYGYGNYAVIEKYMDELNKINNKIISEIDIGAPFVNISIEKYTFDKQKLSINFQKNDYKS